MTDIAGRARGTQLPIPTTRFGTIEEASVDSSNLYTFPEALPGLPGSHRYALIEDSSYDPMCWLQSLEEPLVCLPVVPLAGTSLDQYAAIAARASGLQLAEVGACILLITRYDNHAQSFVANLLAPIVLEPATGTGRQIVLDGQQYQLRQALQWNAQQRSFGLPC